MTERPAPSADDALTISNRHAPAPSEAEALVERLRKVVPHAGAVTIFDMLVAEHRVTCDRGAECQTPPLVEEAQRTIREAASLIERLAKERRCEGTLGTKPTWMSEGQYTPCRCELIAGHASEHSCEHSRATLRAEVERLQEQVRPTKPCDLFQNGSDEPCGGPQFSDPQTEGVDLRVCAFHALMNRNYWMTDARTTHARLDLAMRATEKLRYFLPLGWPLEEMDHNHERERDDDPECVACLTNAIGHALSALDAGTTPPKHDAANDHDATKYGPCHCPACHYSDEGCAVCGYIARPFDSAGTTPE